MYISAFKSGTVIVDWISCTAQWHRYVTLEILGFIMPWKIRGREVVSKVKNWPA